ncbi:hypothetical protein Sste5346_010259 [Sporothrix stenoceras]|uniref:Quinate transporter n=1 Tax=Sporothrix stenoceras TaxID=5173 RepID=A0ABR3YGD3_9PEZI
MGMGHVSFAIAEDRPTPKEVYNWRITSCAIVASFSAFAIGYDSAFISTTLALPSFQREFNFASYSASGLTNLQANIVSIYQAGAFFGALAAYPLNYYVGRKKTLYAATIPFIIGASLNCAAHGPALGLMLGGRVLTGFGVGVCSSVAPMYLAELSPPAIRGRLVGTWEIGWQVGGIIGYWINYGVNENLASNHKQWLIAFAIQLVPVGMLFLGGIFIPESPRWLLTKNKREQATKSLCWLRNLEPTHTYILEEISDIDAEVERCPPSIIQPFRSFAKRSIQWRFALGSLLFVLQNCSGINAINYYGPIILKSIGITGTSTALLATGIFGVAKTLCVVVYALVIVDRVPRRTLLMWGAACCSVCMWIIGAYVKIADPSAHVMDSPTGGAIAAIFFFFLWVVPYELSWSSTPWLINAEMFPLDVRGLGQASAAASNWFWNFIVTRFTPRMVLSMKYGFFFFFASLLIVAIVFVYFLVPETSTIPLEAVDRLFSIHPVRKAHAIVLADVRREHAELRHQLEGDGEKVEQTGGAQHDEIAAQQDAV